MTHLSFSVETTVHVGSIGFYLRELSETLSFRASYLRLNFRFFSFSAQFVIIICDSDFICPTPYIYIRTKPNHRFKTQFSISPTWFQIEGAKRRCLVFTSPPTSTSTELTSILSSRKSPRPSPTSSENPKAL